MSHDDERDYAEEAYQAAAIAREQAEELDHHHGVEPITCRWFYLCNTPASGLTVHPVLAFVPTCTQHHLWADGSPRGPELGDLLQGPTGDLHRVMSVRFTKVTGQYEITAWVTARIYPARGQDTFSVPLYPYEIDQYHKVDG